MIFNRHPPPQDSSDGNEHGEGSDPATGLLRMAAGLPDQELADVIVEFARHNRIPDLKYYLRLVPGLAERPIPLDAAIEMVLRAYGDRGIAIEHAVKVLCVASPELTTAIETAAALNVEVSRVARDRAPVSPPELALPFRVGPPLPDGSARYELHERMGSGSEGTVYLGIDRAFMDPGQPAWVAVKRLLRGVSASEDALDESSRARRVVHPNVVRALDRFEDDKGVTHYVFESVRGGSLDAWRRAIPGPIPPRQAAHVCAQIARGVQAAHAAGLIHRDLKPSNVLMSEKGVPKVTDFGIARLSETKAGHGGMGTLGFCAPEQYQGDDEHETALMDVYALGGLLYWLLTDQMPNGNSVAKAAENLSTKGWRPPSPLVTRSGLDADLAAICERALAPLEAGRYMSADALAIDLEHWLGHEPLPWKKSSLARRAQLAVKRSPQAAVVVTTLVMGSALAIAWGVAASRSETAKAYELELLAERERSHQEDMQEMKERDIAVQRVMSSLFPPNSVEKPSASWLNTVTFLEALMGPRVLPPDAKGSEIWDKRVDVARAFVDDAALTGRSNELEVMLWESSLCVWLLRDEQGADALTRLRALTPRWQKIVAADDPWLLHLSALEALAEGWVVTGDAPASREARLNALERADQLSNQMPMRPVALKNLIDQFARKFSMQAASPSIAPAAPGDGR